SSPKVGKPPIAGWAAVVEGVVGVKSERNQSNEPVPSLQAGQIWTLKDKCLEVKRVGKYLVELLITQNERVEKAGEELLRLGRRLESIQSVQKFLQAHNAVLSR